MEYVGNKQTLKWRTFVAVLGFSINNSLNRTIRYIFSFLNYHSTLRSIHLLKFKKFDLANLEISEKYDISWSNPYKINFLIKSKTIIFFSRNILLRRLTTHAECFRKFDRVNLSPLNSLKEA